MNRYGEEPVFAQRRGEKTGPTARRPDCPTDAMITVADLVVNREEATRLSSCLAASRPLRQGRT
ncbi:hypothetical protein [Streptomyces phaeolivaceus]|nr:hypothetical protein [Streptomyces phaeolivaceus]